MKKIKKIFFIPLIFLIVLTSCDSVKEGLTGSKKKNSDEFLIEKKNPLTKPPDYEKLPSPDQAVEDEETDNDDFNLKKLLGKSQKNTKKKASTQTQNSNLEKSISDKIKNN
jgi:hypothetical protein|tara:strand:- start:242 stop:574 length:333 start_codon:yes stop_codon:yes gene_type:complete